MVTRRQILVGLAALGALGTAGGYVALKPFINPEPAPVGFDLRDGTYEQAVELLKANPAVDIHSHPGRTFVHGASDLNLMLRLYTLLGSFEKRTIDDMRAGHVAAASFSGVADFPVLERSKGGLTTRRDFRAGEAWEYFQAQLHHLGELVEKGWVKPVLEPADILDAHNNGDVGMLVAMEGGDFIDGEIGRVGKAYDDGLRMLTLVHYRNNDIGDIITEPLEEGGLTDFGGEVVKEMNRLGMMIDLSHASEKTALAVTEISGRPMCLTHTHIKGAGGNSSRFVSKELAGAVVDRGGIIGAWPAGIGIKTLGEFIIRIEELINEAGEDGVAIGADMDANYKPVYGNFRQMPLIVGALMERGHSHDAIAKIIGGNFLRVFEDNAA